MLMLLLKNGAEMNFMQDDKIFLDTNVLCYLYDSRDLIKQNYSTKTF